MPEPGGASAEQLSGNPHTSSRRKLDTLSAEQRDAYGSAQRLLDLRGCSKDGLIDQLSSAGGPGYSRRDAKRAVEALDVDWNEQAVRAAESYRKMVPFSIHGLIEQLESEDGGRFTHTQAVYGAKHSGDQL